MMPGCRREIMMPQKARFLPFVLALCLPSIAWAGGTAVVPPLVSGGVDSKVTNNYTSLLSSELDFSGAFDAVNEIPAPASLNASCLTSTSCLAGIAKANDADAVMAGMVSPGGSGFTIKLVMYDAKKNAIVQKKTYDVGTDVAAAASVAPKMVKEMTGQSNSAQAKADDPTGGVKADAFSDEEDFDFEKGGGDLKGKTKLDTKAKGKKLEDAEDDEEVAAAAKAKSDAAAKAKAKAEAAAKAEAEATARAEAEAKAKAKAEAEARARAAVEARARAEAEAKAKAAEEEEARAEEEAAAKARMAKAKSKAKPASEEEDLEDELANFSFGGGGKVADTEEPPPEEEEEVDTRSFSERHASKVEPKPTKTSAKTTASRAKVEDESEDGEADEPADEPADEEEEAPVVKRKPVVEEEEEEPVVKRKPVPADEEEDTPRFSSRHASEEEEEAPKPRKKVGEEEDEAPPSRRKVAEDEEDMDRPGVRRSSEDAALRFGLAVRGGYSHYVSLDFGTLGLELQIPVAKRVEILIGGGSASTNRNYSDAELKVIADANGIAPEEVQQWNTIVPLNVGVVYKVPVTNIQPYVGADGLAVAYTGTPDFAFGARVRGGVDFMVSENFGLNVDVGVGFLSGDKFSLIQKDLTNFGLYPTGQAGAVLVF